MSFKTLEVEIDHGHVTPLDGTNLPERGRGLLTLITPAEPAMFPEVRGPRPSGLARGEFTVPDDFNAPLPDQLLRAFEGE